MTVAFLAPDIHDLPTGGNIYNRRVMGEMQAVDGAVEQSVERVTWPTDAPPQRPGASIPGDVGAVVVDSLLMQHAGAVQALREAVPQARLVLLAHYLHCVDPSQSGTEAARRERDLLPVFDGAVTTSTYVRAALAEEGLPRASVAVAPPGLDAPFRAPPPNRATDSDGPRRLLTVANVLPGKGLPELVEVLETLGEETGEETGETGGEAWTWTLVGNEALDPDFAASFRERVAASPVQERITLAGTVPEGEMRAVYDAHDVFVVPSRFETCSMSTREAMARGLAVVAYAVGGLPENFSATAPEDAKGPDAGAAGRLVEPGDTAALAAAIGDVVADAALCRRLGRAARERSTAFPSWEETARRFAASLAGPEAVGEGKR
jgi:glycosyltransferase involved in cell wall biosynthesis